MAHVSQGAVQLITRSGLDWAKRYGDLPDAFRLLPCNDAVIDGEIVVLDDKGISRFAALQDALSQGAGNKLVFYAFDLLHLDGWDLSRAPLVKRKAAAAAAAGRRRRALGDPAQRPCARRRPRALRPGDRDGARRHHLETRLGALPERPQQDLDQDQGRRRSATS